MATPVVALRPVVERLRRLIVTLSYLKPTQMLFYVIRRKLPARGASGDVTVERTGSFRLVPPLCTAPSLMNDGRFRFLNVTGPVAESSRNWNPRGYSRLWRYNLHYFDCLRQPGITSDQADALIRSWIAANPKGTEPGWEPFPTSLRIVNWIFASQSHPAAFGSDALNSLYLQARWLYRNDERHILANHYFENLKALVFAGAYFSGPEPRGWLRRSLPKLDKQLSEQILPDGGHYERSPLYHARMVENCLDLLNLGICNPGSFPDSFCRRLETVAARALSWLNDIVFPDGQIPLFNDSAFGIAPTAADLSGYADRLFGYAYTAGAAPELICKNDAGLYGVRTGPDMILMDCGDIGPHYQPGHTHCDYLSYELMLDGQRVVVDTGVYEYERGPLRDYVRSSRAHNTLVVDDDEQSELWGEFRVGSRAEKVHGGVARRGNHIEVFGRYRGFFRGQWGVKPRFTVARSIALELAGTRIASLVVADRVDGTGCHLLQSYVHMHPECSLVWAGAHVLRIVREDGRSLGLLSLPADCTCDIRETTYHPQFGIKLANRCIVLRKRALLPATITYRLGLPDDAAGPARTGASW